MADRIRHIKGRNLVVCETFDDFAAAVENTDFTVEDVVGYVVSLSNVYYWLNVESVWGAIGFSWDYNVPMDPEESAQYLNVWKRMEHVLSTGYNVDKKNPEDPDEEIPNDRPDGPLPGEEGYEFSEANKFDIAQQRRLTPITKGYGHFNATTIPFTHIPSLPDGYRITAITNSTLANINITDGVLYIDKSDWTNLNNIDGICARTMTLYADLDGSNITSASSIMRSEHSGKLYLKANLNNIPNHSVVSSRCYGTIVANDYYKDLNIRLGKDSDFYIYLNSKSSYNTFDTRDNYPTYKWEGTGPFKPEYFFSFGDYTSVYCPSYYSHSGNPNATRGIARVACSNGEFYFMNYHNYDDSVNNGVYFAFQHTDEEIIDLTIDCTNGISDVRLDWDLSNRGEETQAFRMLPIKYLGNITSIGTYNPSLQIEDDAWSHFDQSLVDKLNHSLGDYIFHNIIISNATKKCPYTIDCRNLTSVRIFTHMRLTVKDFQNYDPDTGNDKAIDIFPNLIVDNNKTYTTFDLRMYERYSAPYTKIPTVNIKAIYVSDNAYTTLYIGNGTHITCTQISGNCNWRVYDCSIPQIKLKKLREDVSLSCHMTQNCELNIDKFYKNTLGYINFFEVDATDEELKEGIVNTTVGINKGTNQYYEVRHPFILSNAKCGMYNGAHKNYYTDFRLVYRSFFANGKPFSYPNYTNAELIAFAECFADTDNETEYKIILSTDIYNRMSSLSTHGMTLLEYITSLGYTPAFE